MRVNHMPGAKRHAGACAQARLPVQLEAGHLAAERVLQAGRAAAAGHARQAVLQDSPARQRGRGEHDVRAALRAALGREAKRLGRLQRSPRGPSACSKSAQDRNTPSVLVCRLLPASTCPFQVNQERNTSLFAIEDPAMLRRGKGRQSSDSLLSYHSGTHPNHC